jgi:leucyl aminopeptidase
MYILNSSNISDCISIKFIKHDDYESYLASVSSSEKNWLEQSKFKCKLGSFCVVPANDGSISHVVCGRAESQDGFWDLGAIAAKLPVGNYEVDSGILDEEQFYLALSWGLSCYKFDDFKKSQKEFPSLKLHSSIDYNSLQYHIDSIYQLRDLINLPANALGPEDLGKVVATVASEFSASFKQTVGEDLIKEGFPAIHTVGRASVREPRLLELSWGDGNPFKLALIGKGVCFDSGGLDIKPAAGMRDMKKDMGGAAHALALARMIMAHNLPIELKLYIPTVDNAISGNAYMPGDILSTRAGITVENDNTDAEGRLILSDAIDLAQDYKPDLMIDFATLTGAARIALGPDLPAMFCNNEDVAHDVLESANSYVDPIWRMPLFSAYNKFIDSKLADVRSCGSSGGYGGAITAALFLQKFVHKDQDWIHFDIMAANTRDLPGRPEGGEAMGIRALFNYLKAKVAS